MHEWIFECMNGFLNACRLVNAWWAHELVGAPMSEKIHG